MDIGPVEPIRTVQRVVVKRGPRDVTPALGVERAARMEENGYRESRNQDRGMEEEAEVVEESEDESGSDAEAGNKSGVDCFA